MWVLRFRVFDEKNKLSQALRKNKVRVYYYPSNHYLKNGRYYFVAIGLIQGEEKNKKKGDACCSFKLETQKQDNNKK